MEYMEVDTDTKWHEHLSALDFYREPFGLAVAFWASLGVRHVSEVTLSLAAQFLYWYLGHHGPEPIYSMLAGIQFGRKQYKYALPATILDGYYTIDGFSKAGFLSPRSMFISIVWFVGFLAGKYRIF